MDSARQSSSTPWEARWSPPAPPPRSPLLRQLGRLSVGWLIGGALWWLGHATIATIAATAASVVFVLQRCPPPVSDALHRLELRLGRGVGIAVGWALLIPLYVLFFWPFRLLLRGGSRDALHRELLPRASTYFRKRPAPSPEGSSYARQF